jgi:DNA-binding beta-propeller fold protein YncE
MMMKKTAGLLMILMLLITVSAGYADDSNSMKEDGFSTSYSYNYDYWGDVQMTPDPYRVLTVIDSSSLGLEQLDNLSINNPQGLFARGGDVYVADTGNNRILQLNLDGEKVTLTRIITEISGAEPATLNGPTDLFADEEGNIYIADYNNHRVIMANKDLNLMKEFRKPTDATFNQSSEFLPSKIAVDVAGRVYVLATNVNKGFMKYESDTSFTGYIGANPVKIDMADYIWKRYFMSREQRAASESFVPTEYENLYIDEKGFIYATNTVFSEWELKSDTAKPIRRLNGVGNDILIKNDRYPPIGDLYWKSESIQYGPSKLTDITALDNEIYVAVDKIRGRLFGYDSQGVMLWAFGTKGNADGAFNRPTALDHIGYDLLVLDGLKNSVTVFTPTEYGQLIYDATDTYLDGDYDRSAELWQEVMKLNANYPLAFRGLGRSMLRQEKYLEAMDYFERAHDRDDYGRAFKQYRKIWIEKNVLWVVLILAVLLLIPLILGRIKKMRWEVIMHEHSKVRH